MGGRTICSTGFVFSFNFSRLIFLWQGCECIFAKPVKRRNHKKSRISPFSWSHRSFSEHRLIFNILDQFSKNFGQTLFNFAITNLKRELKSFRCLFKMTVEFFATFDNGFISNY